jgi:hypothetical protein
LIDSLGSFSQTFAASLNADFISLLFDYLAIDIESADTFLKFFMKVLDTFDISEQFPLLISEVSGLVELTRGRRCVQPYDNSLRISIFSRSVWVLTFILRRDFRTATAIWDSAVVHTVLEYIDDEQRFILPNAILAYFHVLVGHAISIPVLRGAAGEMFSEMAASEIATLGQDDLFFARATELLGNMLEHNIYPALLDEGRENGIFSLFEIAAEKIETAAFHEKGPAVRFVCQMIRRCDIQKLVDESLAVTFFGIVAMIVQEGLFDMAVLAFVLNVLRDMIARMQEWEGWGEFMREQQGETGLLELLQDLEEPRDAAEMVIGLLVAAEFDGEFPGSAKPGD